MAAPRSTAGGRPHVVAVRLSDSEVEQVDAARGSLSRSMYLRKVLLDEQKAAREGRKV